MERTEIWGRADGWTIEVDVDETGYVHFLAGDVKYEEVTKTLTGQGYRKVVDVA